MFGSARQGAVQQAEIYKNLCTSLLNHERRCVLGTQNRTMIKKIFRFALVLSFVGVLGALGVSPALATTTQAEVNYQVAATPTLQSGPVEVVTFQRLDMPDTTLYGPYDSLTVSYSLPPSWQLLDGTELELSISAFSATDSGVTNASSYIGASLEVSYNGKLISTLLLESGENKKYTVKIPVDALSPESADGRHVLYLFLDAGIDCDYTFHKTTVVVNSESQFTLLHAEKSVPVDLGNLPRPLYYRDSITAYPAAIVVPNSSSADAMRAALIVSAGIGRMTNRQQSLALINTDELTEEIRNNYNLIFVGKPSEYELLTPFKWPASVINRKLTTSGLNDEDGLLQMINSPWNPARVLIWVGGNTDSGVIKAAQAFSTDTARPLFDRSKIIVADIKSYANEAIQDALQAPEDRTLGDLGYTVNTATGAGFSQIDYSFYVTPGLMASETPYLDLVFNNSALLDYSLSGLVIYVNDLQVGSERFSEDTSSIVTRRTQIPKDLIHMGVNDIRIEITLVPVNECSLFNFNNLWVTLYPSSILHLPLGKAPVTASIANSLSDYPTAFLTNPDMSNLAFVLPKSDVNAWRVASNIAYDLGSRVQGALLDFSTAYDGQVPDEILNHSNIIMVGLPKSLPSIATLNSSLPAPFDLDKNVTIVESQNIVYRIPENVNLGYLELLPSPWASNYTFLGVFGSNADGLTWAGNGLIAPDLKSLLQGNLAVLTANEVVTADTRTGVGLPNVVASIDDVATPQAEVVSTPLPESKPSFRQQLLTRTDYIPYAVGGIVLVIIILLVWAQISSSRQRTKK